MYIPVCFLFVKKKEAQVLEAPCGLKAMRTTNRGVGSGPGWFEGLRGEVLTLEG